MAIAVSNGVASTIVSTQRSLWQRIFMTIKLRFIKAIVTGAFMIFGLPGIRNTAELPTYTKIYPIRQTLVNRIFIPKSYKTGDSLPLYLDIHGGGFALMSPVVDDPFCSWFANEHKIIVVSLDYPKAPSHKYPSAIEALTDLVNAVLDDEELPFDKKKVAIGGFSAGANLSLALTQQEDIRGRIGGVAAFYPPVDFVTKGPEKMKTRPFGSPPDALENAVSMFDFGYTTVGQDLQDPLLSMAYAERENLPPKLFVVGCEFDMLCREAELFAEKMAQVGTGERTGSDTLWEKNGVRWEKILGELHGFDQMIAFGETRIRVEKRRKEMWHSAAEWLFREVYV
ncbi:Esterase [Hyphodiscus hymeniophilus]|uniref:Esterase n=1 Tax=Hyphodiscus hymeniophilus TaxID=353542 RepID=A0A9P7AWN6_9HELO|nr:Esterase [Hyphodiscus hymeniophilus]